MSFLHPQRYVARIDQIDVDELVAQGVRLVLFDRDNTVVPRSTRVADPAAVAWLGRVRAAGIGTCMISNNFHAAPVEASAAELGSGVVHHAMKPAPFAVWVALAREGVPAEQTVLVGDRLYAGNAAGCSSAISGGAPILPYCKDSQGRGPAWEHSLFEDNAEFAYGFFHAQDAIRKELLIRLGLDGTVE